MRRFANLPQVAGTPVRWTPMESIFKGTYSQKSDVWSWAVMVWELATSCQFPYTALWDDQTTLDLVNAGLRLHQPPCIPDVVYALLAQCWHTSPEMRPTFAAVQQQMRKIEAALLHGTTTKRPAAGFVFLKKPEAAEFLKAKPGQSDVDAGAPKLKRKGSLRGFDDADEGDAGAGNEVTTYIQFWQLEFLPTYVEVRNPNPAGQQELFRCCRREEETAAYIPVTSGAADLCDHDGKLYMKTYEQVKGTSTWGRARTVLLRDVDLVPQRIPLMRRSSTAGNKDQLAALGYRTRKRKPRVIKAPRSVYAHLNTQSKGQVSISTSHYAHLSDQHRDRSMSESVTRPKTKKSQPVVRPMSAFVGRPAPTSTPVQPGRTRKGQNNSKVCQHANVYEGLVLYVMAHV